MCDEHVICVNLYSITTSAWPCSGQITGIALGVPSGLIFCLAMVFLGVLYHRGLAIQRKRAMRRYLESGEVKIYQLKLAVYTAKKQKLF